MLFQMSESIFNKIFNIQMYFIIRQIPKEWRSFHLRNYFDQIIQIGCFDTFHFKHRRETVIVSDSGNIPLATTVTIKFYLCFLFY